MAEKPSVTEVLAEAVRLLISELEAFFNERD